MKNRFEKVVFHAIVTVIIFYAVFPFYWAIVTSLKSGSSLFNVQLFPSEPSLRNYIELFSEESLLKSNRIGTTPVHLAAANGCLHQIPQKFLTERILNDKNFLGQSCLHFAISRIQKKETNPKIEIPLILSKLSDKSLRYYLKRDPDTKLISAMIKQELLKRKIVKELASKEQSIEI